MPKWNPSKRNERLKITLFLLTANTLVQPDVTKSWKQLFHQSFQNNKLGSKNNQCSVDINVYTSKFNTKFSLQYTLSYLIHITRTIHKNNDSWSSKDYWTPCTYLIFSSALSLPSHNFTPLTGAATGINFRWGAFPYHSESALKKILKLLLF